MKKYMPIVMSVLSLFMSCNKEIIEVEKAVVKENREIVSVEVSIGFGIDSLYYAMLRPTFKYEDEDGKVYSESYTSLKRHIRKNVKYTKFPAEVDFRLLFDNREPIIEPIYVMGSSGVVSCIIEYSDGTFEEYVVLLISSRTHLKKEVFDWWVNIYNEKGGLSIYDSKLIINKDGTGIEFHFENNGELEIITIPDISEDNWDDEYLK